MDYGWVKEIPDGLKKGDYYKWKRYDVSRTGRKEQYYTLYRDFEACLYGYWFRKRYHYEGNLSTDRNKAMAKARKIASDSDISFYETPKAELHVFEAFGLKWKEGKKAFYATPNSSFWDIWKKDKEAIKQAGFWVSKGKQGFLVFHKI